MSDLLLHVVDAHSEHRDGVIDEVNRVLDEIGAEKIHRIEVFNKIDLLEDRQPRVDRDESGKPVRIWLSAQTGSGIDGLLNALAELLAPAKLKKICYLNPDQGEIRAKLFTCAKIIDEHINDSGGSNLIIEIDNKHLGLLRTVKTEEVQ